MIFYFFQPYTENKLFNKSKITNKKKTHKVQKQPIMKISLNFMKKIMVVCNNLSFMSVPHIIVGFLHRQSSTLSSLFCLQVTRKVLLN